ncbi:MAG: HAMP domain-containing protein [Deltaproteobacteria bacterium]|nr:HAMP domain-containing protein [Deltaproteobacteria bacterium]
MLTLFTIISVLVAAELSLLRIIRNLSKTARQFGKGNFDIRVPVPKHHGELSELALEFNSMAEALLQRHNELLKAHDRLKTLSRHLQNAREEEARRIARELHDGIGQILTIIKIDLATLQKKCLTCKETSKASAIETEIIKIKESIDEAIKFVRRISSELRPAVLDRLGFPSALEWQTREFEIRTSISTQLEIKNIKESIDEDISTALFRVTQEALTNVIRHANASEVHISLICNENDFSLSIRDNGKGIANSPPYGINTSGIIGMEERVRLLNGQFSILGEHQKGTTIRIQIPKRKPHRSYDAYTTL